MRNIAVIPEAKKKFGKEDAKIQIVQDKPPATCFTYTVNEISLPGRLQWKKGITNPYQSDMDDMRRFMVVLEKGNLE